MSIGEPASRARPRTDAGPAPRRAALRFAAIYTLVGTAWIVVSDLAFDWATDAPTRMTAVQIAKGIFYVLVTAVLVYALTLRALRRIRDEFEAVQLEKSRNMLEAVLGNLGDAVLVIDPASRSIISCNSAVQKVFGYEPQELIGRGSEILHVDRQAWQEFGRIGEGALDARGVFRCQYRMRRKDGTIIDTENTVATVDRAAGWRTGVISIVRDISDRIALEAQLRQAQKLEAIGTLAAGIAHEINNPMTSIGGFAEMIGRDRDAGDRARHFAGRIGAEAERVNGIVHNLLGYTRQEGDAPATPARMTDIVESTLSLIRSALRRDGIRLSVDVPADLPEVPCRPQQIQQVLMNLLTNARDAVNERHLDTRDGKRIDIRAAVVDHDDRKWIRTTVEDTGKGIDAARINRLFEPFYTSKDPGHGTGLGLWISYGIVRRHHGTITVESEPGRFARFDVDLPLGLPAAVSNDHGDGVAYQAAGK